MRRRGVPPGGRWPASLSGHCSGFGIASESCRIRSSSASHHLIRLVITSPDSLTKEGVLARNGGQLGQGDGAAVVIAVVEDFLDVIAALNRVDVLQGLLLQGLQLLLQLVVIDVLVFDVDLLAQFLLGLLLH